MHAASSAKGTAVALAIVCPPPLLPQERTALREGRSWRQAYFMPTAADRWGAWAAC